MTRTRLGLAVAAVALAFTVSPVQGLPDAADPMDSPVRTAADDFATVSDGPQIGDLSSVRVENGTEPTVSAPTFSLTGPAPAPQTTSAPGSTTTSKVGDGRSGKESTSVSGSGSFSSSQGSGPNPGSSSGSRSGGSSSGGSQGGSESGGGQSDPNQICNMPAMC